MICRYLCSEFGAVCVCRNRTGQKLQGQRRVLSTEHVVWQRHLSWVFIFLFRCIQSLIVLFTRTKNMCLYMTSSHKRSLKSLGPIRATDKEMGYNHYFLHFTVLLQLTTTLFSFKIHDQIKLHAVNVFSVPRSLKWSNRLRAHFVKTGQMCNNRYLIIMLRQAYREGSYQRETACIATTSKTDSMFTRISPFMAMFSQRRIRASVGGQQTRNPTLRLYGAPNKRHFMSDLYLTRPARRIRAISGDIALNRS